MKPEDLTHEQTVEALAGMYRRLMPEDLRFLNSLRNRGFAVCVFTPEELEQGKISRKVMEEILVESGNEVMVDLDDVKTWRNPEDHEEPNDDE